jgi:hypothetical protein
MATKDKNKAYNILIKHCNGHVYFKSIGKCTSKKQWTGTNIKSQIIDHIILKILHLIISDSKKKGTKAYKSTATIIDTINSGTITPKVHRIFIPCCTILTKLNVPYFPLYIQQENT